jgi:hypothetical protein
MATRVISKELNVSDFSLARISSIALRTIFSRSIPLSFLRLGRRSSRLSDFAIHSVSIEIFDFLLRVHFKILRERA